MRSGPLCFVAAIATAACMHTPPSAPAGALSSPNAQGVARSDEHAKVLLDAIALVEPEEAGELGYADADRRTSDLSPAGEAHTVAVYREAAAKLRTLLMEEDDPATRTDLQILIGAADRRADEHADTDDERQYISVARFVFRGIESLLSMEHTAARRDAALVRLRAYAGQEPGTAPATAQAEARLRAALTAPAWQPPLRTQVARDLDATAALADGIAEMMSKSAVEAAPALDALRRQFTAYDAFVRGEVLPRAREDFRRPRPQYLRLLSSYGIEGEPEALAAKARRVFRETQSALERLAPEVAASAGASRDDYRSVLRALRAQQIKGEPLLELYRERVRALDLILEREQIVTRPPVPLPIRFASEAEGAMMPAPFYNAPPLTGARLEGGEFVLPLGNAAMDDFGSPAASWWLAAHEGHPGHGLQFAVLTSRPFSLARRHFAFNSANVEGWGLFAETLVTPHLPPDGRMAALQARLLRAAHAFLDIELNLGLISESEARRLLLEDVVTSEGWAEVCIRRYTFMLPGHAPSYFYGGMELEELRAEIEGALGATFNLREFNDFVLNQGLIPPRELRRATFRALLGRAE